MQEEQQPEVGLGAEDSPLPFHRSRIAGKVKTPNQPGSSTHPQGRSAKSQHWDYQCETPFKTEGRGAKCYIFCDI